MRESEGQERIGGERPCICRKIRLTFNRDFVIWGMENSHDGRRVAPGIMAMDTHLIELSISKHYKRSGICEIFSRFCISCAYNIANTRSLT